MKAWIGARHGSLPVYALQDVPVPQPAAGEVLIRVRAVGLNLVDRFPKKQHFTHSAPLALPIPGMEVSGEVVRVGPRVLDCRAGERVMAMVHGGCAEYCCANARLLMRMPGNMAWTDAAAVPVSFLTAHDALLTRGGLRRGGSVLIQGVTTGVGLAAVQLAKSRGAAWIAGTSRSLDKLQRVKPLGLDLGLPSGAGVAEAIRNATGGRGVDVVLDHLGGQALHETLGATRIGGQVVNIGRLAGTRGEIDLELLALRRIGLIGVTFRTRTLGEHAAIVSRFLRQHLHALETQAIRPVIDRVFDFAELPQAIERAVASAQLGKLVLALETA